MSVRIPSEPAEREFDIVSILLIILSHVAGRKYKEFFTRYRFTCMILFL